MLNVKVYYFIYNSVDVCMLFNVCLSLYNILLNSPHQYCRRNGFTKINIFYLCFNINLLTTFYLFFMMSTENSC